MALITIWNSHNESPTQTCKYALKSARRHWIQSVAIPAVCWHKYQHQPWMHWHIGSALRNPLRTWLLTCSVAQLPSKGSGFRRFKFSMKIGNQPAIFNPCVELLFMWRSYLVSLAGSWSPVHVHEAIQIFWCRSNTILKSDWSILSAAHMGAFFRNITVLVCKMRTPPKALMAT